MINTDEFENAMNEGRIERKHCKWMLAEVKELRAWKKFVCDLVKQQDGPHLREMLKELIE